MKKIIKGKLTKKSWQVKTQLIPEDGLYVRNEAIKGLTTDAQIVRVLVNEAIKDRKRK